MVAQSFCRVEVKSHPDVNDVRSAQNTWLRDYNLEQTKDSYHASLVIHLVSQDNRVVGGLVGEYLWNWLHIISVAIDTPYRRSGFGTQIMLAAEADATNRGYHRAYLETFSFQARPFYEKLGYVVFGVLDDFPIGHKKYFMFKVIS